MTTSEYLERVWEAELSSVCVVCSQAAHRLKKVNLLFPLTHFLVHRKWSEHLMMLTFYIGYQYFTTHTQNFPSLHSNTISDKR